MSERFGRGEKVAAIGLTVVALGAVGVVAMGKGEAQKAPCRFAQERTIKLGDAVWESLSIAVGKNGRTIARPIYVSDGTLGAVSSKGAPIGEWSINNAMPAGDVTKYVQPGLRTLAARQMHHLESKDQCMVPNNIRRPASDAIAVVAAGRAGIGFQTIAPFDANPYPYASAVAGSHFYFTPEAAQAKGVFGLQRGDGAKPKNFVREEAN